MSNMSIQVQNRAKVAEYVGSSVKVHGDAVAKALAENVAGLDVATVHKVLDALVGHLESRTRDAEHAYTAEQADDPPIRNARDQAAARLIETLQQLREVVGQTLGPDGVARYGLTGQTPRVPQALAEHAGNVVSLLRKHPAAGEGRFVKELRTEKAADQLAPMVDALSEQLGRVDREVRELQAALVDRDRAVAQWMGDYPGIASILEGMYRLAGNTELADRIRPTARRTSGQATDLDDASEPGQG